MVPIVREVWTEPFSKVFEALKTSLMNPAILAPPDDNRGPFLFTYASVRNWTTILTHIPNAHTGPNMEEKSHDRLEFLSGMLKESAALWATADKEAFSII